MKKIFFLFCALVISANVYSQSVSALGNSIIEQNSFSGSKSLLQRQGFTLFSADELRAFGHNPNIVAIGMKGNSPSSSILATVNGISQTNRVKEVTLICPKSYSAYIEKDLRDVGYEAVGERSYVEDGRFNVTETTYQRNRSGVVDVVISKLTPDGTAQVTFKRK